MVDILFLGTGGGRVNLIRQLRGTGGFVLLGKYLSIHVDPGPGALMRLHSAHQDPTKTDAIIVTHMHVDHVSDAAVLSEAMCNFALQRGGCIVAARSVLQGDKNGDKSISTYHQSKMEQCIALRAGEEKTVTIAHPTKKSHHASAPPASTFTIRGVMVKHDDQDGFGFVLEMDGVRIGYTSDTEYLPAVHNAAYAGIDVLVANNLKSSDDGIPDHLHSGHLIQLLKVAKPKLCILTHMGMKLIQSGPEAEAALIQKESGVPTFAAHDGTYYCTDRCGWFRPEKSSDESGEPKSKGQKKLV